MIFSLSVKSAIKKHIANYNAFADIKLRASNHLKVDTVIAESMLLNAKY